MILTAGLTPAWQQIMVFDDFRYGQVNRAAEVHWCARERCSTRALPRIAGRTEPDAGHGGRAAAGGDRARNSSDGRAPPLGGHAGRHAVCTTILDRRDRHDDRVGRERAPWAGPRSGSRFRNAYAEEVGRPTWRWSSVRCRRGARETFYRELLALTPCPAMLDFRGQGLRRVPRFAALRGQTDREELALDRGPPVRGDRRRRWRPMWSLNERGAAVGGRRPGPWAGVDGSASGQLACIPR